MPEHEKNGKDAPWRTDMLDASRAIYAETKSLIKEETGKVITDLPVQISQMVERLIDKRLREFEAGLGDRITKEAAHMIEARVTEAAETIRRIISEAPPPVVNVTVPDHGPAIINVTVPDFSIPQPNVIFNAPEVKFPPLDFSTMPIPVVNIAQPSITVQAPEFTLPAPNVSVNVPEFTLPTPQVNVQMPRRKIKKHITYDASGRPETIEESEE